MRSSKEIYFYHFFCVRVSEDFASNSWAVFCYLLWYACISIWSSWYNVTSKGAVQLTTQWGIILLMDNNKPA